MKGHKTCPICGENTFFVQLKYGRKAVYLSFAHATPLSEAMESVYTEEKAPKILNGEQVYERVKHLMSSCEKVKRNTIEKNVWKKRSIFFNLLYLKYLFVRHCLDVMHIKKNICDSIIRTLLNVIRLRMESKIDWI